MIMKRPRYKKGRKLLLSIDRAYLVIYWSLTTLVFFSAIISALEIQRVNVLTLLLILVIFIMVSLSRSSYVFLLDDELVFSYFFGLKTLSFFLDDIYKVIITEKRKIELMDKKTSLHTFYLSKKNVETFCAYLHQKKPSIPIAK